MSDEHDDGRPETAERDAASGSFTPDLTAAFFAELDAAEPAPLHGGLEQRLEALLDLTTAFDGLVDAPSGAGILDAEILPGPASLLPESSAIDAIEKIEASGSSEPRSSAPESLKPESLAPESPEAEAPEPESLAPESFASMAFEAAPIDAMFGDAAPVAPPAEPVASQPPPSVQSVASDDSSSISSASAIAIASMASVALPRPADMPQPSVADDAAADLPLDLEEFIVFSLADTRCVVPIRNVVEVGRIPEAAPVPHAPAWLHGLGNLRGQVLSLIDLRAFLGLGRIRPSAGRMIVLRADADDVIAGLMVDQVHQIVQLAPSRFQAAPSTLAPGYGGFVWGVCDYGLHTMIGLDVDGVLGAEALHGDSVLAV